MQYTYEYSFNSSGIGGVGVYPPLMSTLLAWYNGNDGENLEDSISPLVIDPLPDVVDVACLQLEGVSYIDTGVYLNYTGDYRISITFMFPTASSTTMLFCGLDATDEGIRVLLAGNTMYVSHDAEDNTHTIFSMYNDGLWHTLVIERIGTRFLSTLDDLTPEESVLLTAKTINSRTALIGRITTSNAQHFTGKLSRCTASDYFDYPMQETAGNQVIDVSGNKNQGTIETTNSTTLAAVRACRSDALASWNALHGFDKQSDEVAITQYYDDAVMAVMVTQDDIYRQDGTHALRWDRFMDNAALCNAHNIVATSCSIMGKNLDSDWASMLSAVMADSGNMHMITTHSMNHPTIYPSDAGEITAQEILEYVTSKELFLANITLPDTHNYNGSPYLTNFMQWGGWVFPDEDDRKYSDEYFDSLNSMLADAGYLANRDSRTHLGTSFGYELEWDQTNGIYHAYTTALSSSAGRVTDGTLNYQADFDHAYANNGRYYLYNHPWMDSDWAGSGADNEAIWATWAAYVGGVAGAGPTGAGNLDVWYTDPDSWINYEYLRGIARPSTTYEETDESTITMGVSIGNAHRVKYGLSTPVTYKVKKPAAWGTTGTITAFYRDTVDTSWVEMTEKTSSDYFTAINCFRNDSTDVLVSQGFPQTSDSFEIKITRVV